MESQCKLQNDPLLSNTESPFSTILSNPFRSTLLVFVRFFFLITLVTSMAAFIAVQEWRPISPFPLFLGCLFMFFFVFKLYLSRPPPVYLVDFSCFKPPSSWRVPFSSFLENASMIGTFDDESLAFMSKILTFSGLSEETYLPPALHYIPPKTHQRESIKEVEMVLFPVMEDLLSKTRLSPQDIDILIVNCSGFCPSPSLSSIVINKYSMRSDVKSFNLSGMGCSAGAVGIDLAQNLLKIYKNSNAIVLSTEILSTGWYPGRDKSKLILNCLFRMGSAAILLSNKKEAKASSKYKLFITLRTQGAYDDKAYFSAIREEDSEGNLGFTIRGDLLTTTGETLKTNIRILGSQILPITEKIRHGVSFLRKKYVDKSGEIYTPNFKTVIQHFCLPASGRPVIREIAKGLKLKDADMEPALMTLHKFGNQSSSALWYELAYMEAKQRVNRGEKVWQFGMGSGCKCISLVWECLRSMKSEAEKGPWSDCIHRYPVMAHIRSP